jgi:uncharacterized repeat protein (TIGR01451 family)
MIKETRISMNIRARLFTLLLSFAVLVPCASAQAAAPVWDLATIANTTAVAGGQLTYYAEVANHGDGASNGEVSFMTSLPAGMVAVSASGLHPGVALISCTAGDGTSPVAGATVVLCKDPNTVGVSQKVVFKVKVAIDAGIADPSTLIARFSASGGEGPPATTTDPTRITSTLPGFGLDVFDGRLNADQGADLFTQAGGTPYSQSTSLDFNTAHNKNPLVGDATPIEPPKDVYVDLPPGLVGVPRDLPQCTGGQLAAGGVGDGGLCPVASQVGTTRVHFLSLNANGYPTVAISAGPIPLYNMVPPAGVPARFGFSFVGTIVVLDAKLTSGPDYRLVVVARNISEGIAIAGTTVTFWGVPADPRHDAERGCPGEVPPYLGGFPGADSELCVDSEGHPLYKRPPLTSFLRTPTSCSGPLPMSVEADSWFNPGPLNAEGAPSSSDPSWKSASFDSHGGLGYPNPSSLWGSPQGLTGCGSVPFDPSVSVQPTSTAADSPTGLDVGLTLPQTDNPSTINEADLKRIAVELPQGMTLNPSSANGLGACSEAQIALTASTPPTCPDSSKIGTVEVETPLLDHKVPGGIYLAAQDANPFHSLLAMYIVLDDPASGTVIKLPAKLEADPATGQLTTLVDENPQLPFNTLKLHFFSGPTGVLATPLACGTNTTEATLASWANPGLDVHREDSFAVSSSPLGGCPASQAAAPFAPAFSAGTTDNQAGRFSPLVISFSRNDGEQHLSSLSTTLPAGVESILAGVPQCSSADANAGTCPAASRIGSVTVGAGVGPSPYFLKGTVYLTGPYNGGPFGEVVVVPVVAGPLNLGNVIVRGSIRVDSTTAQASVVSDPFPAMVNGTGIPADVRQVEIALDRPGFAFNPTSCDPEALTGALTSVTGASSPLSARFQAASCSGLQFKPKFTAATESNGTFNRDGASLDVKITSGEGPGASSHEANIRKVEVQLPKALPSRLTTLNKACTEHQFAANPAACPPESDVGTVTAVTPVLAHPLTGPAYLVSHGGEAFPDLDLILQGEGITLVVTGHTQIEHGVTFSRFETVPDAPLSSFELRLPEGKFSALAAVGSLCGRTVTTKTKVTRQVHGHTIHSIRKVSRRIGANLAMPTTITAQNSTVVRQATQIAVTGCQRSKGKAKK